MASLSCHESSCHHCLVLTFLGNSGLYWTIFTQNINTAVPVEENADSQTLICVLAARPRQYTTLSNPVQLNFAVKFPAATLYILVHQMTKQMCHDVSYRYWKYMSSVKKLNTYKHWFDIFTSWQIFPMYTLTLSIQVDSYLQVWLLVIAQICIRLMINMQ